MNATQIEESEDQSNSRRRRLSDNDELMRDEIESVRDEVIRMEMLAEHRREQTKAESVVRLKNSVN